MAPGQASERLRELQAQAARDSAALNSEIEAGPSLPQQRATSFRVFSSGATADSESKPLLSKLSVVKELTSTSWKIWLSLLTAAVCSVLLLWLLFGGDDTQLYVATKELTGKPLTASELKARHPDDPCPLPRWFTAECLTEDRLKSQSVHTMCQDEFDELEYSVELLRECKLLLP